MMNTFEKTLTQHVTKLVSQVALLLSHQDRITTILETHNTILLHIEELYAPLSI
jgi:hypothetical protein